MQGQVLNYGIKRSLNMGKQIWNIERVYVRYNIKKWRENAPVTWKNLANRHGGNPPIEYDIYERVFISRAWCTDRPHSFWFSEIATVADPHHFKSTKDWEFFWLRFWNLRYFFISYVKILRFYKKNFLIRPLLGEVPVRFFRVVLGLRGMKKKFWARSKKIFLFFNFGP